MSRFTDADRVVVQGLVERLRGGDLRAMRELRSLLEVSHARDEKARKRASYLCDRVEACGGSEPAAEVARRECVEFVEALLAEDAHVEGQEAQGTPQSVAEERPPPDAPPASLRERLERHLGYVVLTAGAASFVAGLALGFQVGTSSDKEFREGVESRVGKVLTACKVPTEGRPSQIYDRLDRAAEACGPKRASTSKPQPADGDAGRPLERTPSPSQ